MTEEKKICNKCEEVLPKTNEHFFYKNKKKGYFSPYCKKCERARCIEYRKNNPELIRKRHQEYHQENREHILEYQKQYRSTPRYKKMKCERENKRANEDPSYKMRKNISHSVRTYLKNNKGTKKNNTWSALPYSPQQLREHLESQFEDWMTWDNYGKGEGKWNIDHIHPQSLLPYDSLEHPNFLKCWELNNLRPLCSLENSSKGNRRDY